MSPSLRVALAQMTSAPSVEQNLRWMRGVIDEAAQAGAELVCFPENSLFFGPEQERLRAAQSLEGPAISDLRSQAAACGVNLLIGSFAEQTATPGRTANTSVLVGTQGEIVATYRKIHLFDVRVDGDDAYLESSSVEPGPPQAVVATIAGWKIGLTICYDLRFPELYRALSEEGAQVFCVPAAFTRPTGEAHWEVLLRARAIENQGYVLAPAQVGTHFGERATWGHSMVVDPWGTVQSVQEDGAGWELVTLEQEPLHRLRERMPCLTHRRM